MNKKAKIELNNILATVKSIAPDQFDDAVASAIKDGINEDALQAICQEFMEWKQAMTKKYGLDQPKMGWERNVTWVEILAILSSSKINGAPASIRANVLKRFLQSFSEGCEGTQFLVKDLTRHD